MVIPASRMAVSFDSKLRSAGGGAVLVLAELDVVNCTPAERRWGLPGDVGGNDERQAFDARV
ncbi:hypothetical protein STRAU_1735 [Streptomyces aurantiacus JA 4570]|uniref:Uncharacterized protein n=1 Tax=Streptomyces aurantiacus JA 4570 TaxID=1286094 RepID=S4AUL2_9ACTN|nr:hypothetical protein STRAU_1735 [Streptomyces aurantiacus JA 4570]